MERGGETRSDVGGRGAVERLYRESWDDMVRLARLLLGSSSSGAEDVVQDAFVRVAARLGEVEAPRAYLRTAVVNACRSEHRHREVVRRREPPPPSPVLPTYLVDFADALAALPERQRTAIVLRHFGDLPDDEIAEVLGCRRATVRTLVFRGMASLREVIEP